MDYLSALNEKQLGAVMATEGYLRVIAAPAAARPSCWRVGMPIL